MRWNLDALKSWARAVKRDVHALYLAARDPRVPLAPKIAAACIAAYALSPIDLIPDFIPVLGYLDDLIVIPLGILLVIRFIPPHLLAEHRAAAEFAARRPASCAGAIAIILIWLAISAWLCWVLYRRYVS
jgi:uncharacterized membrane protein YkvA (DUF1232 family)